MLVNACNPEPAYTHSALCTQLLSKRKATQPAGILLLLLRSGTESELFITNLTAGRLWYSAKAPPPPPPRDQDIHIVPLDAQCTAVRQICSDKGRI